MDNQEEWKPLKENSNYSASTLGRIKNNRTGHMLHLSCPPSRKYTVAYIYIKEKHKSCTRPVHILVMHAFKGYPLKGQEIDHINGNKHDNRLCNLEYVSQDENIKRAMNKQLSKTYRNKKFIPLSILPNKVKVYKYCRKDRRLIKIYNSIDEACEDLYNFGLTDLKKDRLIYRFKRLLISRKPTFFGLLWKCPQAVEYKNEYLKKSKQV